MAAPKKKKPAPSAAKAKKPASKSPPKPTAGKEPPPTKAEIAAWRAASSAIDLVVEVQTDGAPRRQESAAPVAIASWFAVHATTPPPRRYQFVLQWQRGSRKFIVCYQHDGVAARLPGAGGWLRALDTGRIHAVSSDLRLTRRQLAAVLGGGHEPPTGVAKPPNT
jgi:hypothetical protein